MEPCKIAKSPDCQAGRKNPPRNNAMNYPPKAPSISTEKYTPIKPILIATAPVQGKLTLLGGTWVVISGVISPLIWVITIVLLLITLLITTPEPPSIP